MTKHVYFFGEGAADGDGTLRELLGGKGAGLAEMCRIGVPVPPGFTLTTDVVFVCRSRMKTFAGCARGEVSHPALRDSTEANSQATLPQRAMSGRLGWRADGTRERRHRHPVPAGDVHRAGGRSDPS